MDLYMEGQKNKQMIEQLHINNVFLITDKPYFQHVDNEFQDTSDVFEQFFIIIASVIWLQYRLQHGHVIKYSTAKRDMIRPSGQF